MTYETKFYSWHRYVLLYVLTTLLIAGTSEALWLRPPSNNPGRNQLCGGRHRLERYHKNGTNYKVQNYFYQDLNQFKYFSSSIWLTLLYGTTTCCFLVQFCCFQTVVVVPYNEVNHHNMLKRMSDCLLILSLGGDLKKYIYAKLLLSKMFEIMRI